MLKLAADDRPIVIASLFVLVILALGSAYTLATQGNLAFLNPGYLLQQLQVGAFLGIVAAGMMVVILLGHIDLSVPWTLAAAAMMATAVGGPLAIPVGLGIGLAGRHLQRHRRRLPARAVDDLHARRQRAAARPDGHAHRRLRAADPRHRADDLPRHRPRAGPADGAPGLGAAVGGHGVPAAAHRVRPLRLRDRQPRGRGLPVGRADPRRAGRGLRLAACAPGLAGVLLAGYSTKAYQGMGDAYLLPSIAAVVIGGTHILGGRGRYAGTVVGTILITLLSSVLSVMQMPEAGRQIIYGLVIIVMLLAYGRSRPAGA